MRRSDLVEFANRDRSTPARMKAEFWAERRAQLGAGEGLRIMGELRRHFRTIRPDWPTEADRAADLAEHVRVGEMLRSVVSRPR